MLRAIIGSLFCFLGVALQDGLASAAPPPLAAKPPDAAATGDTPPTTTGAGSTNLTGSRLPRTDSERKPIAESPGGIRGVSRRYDDLDCQVIQSRYGVSVPAGATIIEADGDRLPLENVAELKQSHAPVLILPRGAHALRFRPNESIALVTISHDFQTEYADMTKFFGVGGAIRQDELLSRAARAMDAFNTPFLLNFLGVMYLRQNQTEAAERNFRRALSINPTFSPAHLNLSHGFLDRKNQPEAIRELNLADAFNVGNVYGLTHDINQMRVRLELPLATPASVDASPRNYVSGRETLSEEDRRMSALLRGLSKYATQEEERAKILNNLAVHFADRSKPETSLSCFREALATLKRGGAERYKLAREMLSRMSRICDAAGFAEAEQYRAMATLVSSDR
jgi:tetratricopeptide (TPR) repeat protein